MVGKTKSSWDEYLEQLEQNRINREHVRDKEQLRRLQEFLHKLADDIEAGKVGVKQAVVLLRQQNS